MGGMGGYGGGMGGMGGGGMGGYGGGMGGYGGYGRVSSFLVECAVWLRVFLMDLMFLTSLYSIFSCSVRPWRLWIWRKYLLSSFGCISIKLVLLGSNLIFSSVLSILSYIGNGRRK